eukprot:TRINITY_DN19978_c0_g1_i1.p1 TRINITY_DN19978_c0_g1~~TRINITY_DN19978_c0_g1_i1.p1  ORF type:complete len:172 (+),score=51.63 TRINITY_DN19978_c0_g1_i1:45-560(+)
MRNHRPKFSMNWVKGVSTDSIKFIPNFWVKQWYQRRVRDISFVDCLGKPEQLEKFGEWLGQINFEFQNTLECMVRLMEYSRTKFPSRLVAKKMAKEIFNTYLTSNGTKYIGPLHHDFLVELESKIFPENAEPSSQIFDELGEGCFDRLNQIYPKFLGKAVVSTQSTGHIIC